MQVKQLGLENFRNYGTLAIEPGAELNVFVGRNAQGKSNLLESLYVLATSKSTRAAKDTELIRFDAALRPSPRRRGPGKEQRHGH